MLINWPCTIYWNWLHKYISWNFCISWWHLNFFLKLAIFESLYIFCYNDVFNFSFFNCNQLILLHYLLFWNFITEPLMTDTRWSNFDIFINIFYIFIHCLLTDVLWVGMFSKINIFSSNLPKTCCVGTLYGDLTWHCILGHYLQSLRGKKLCPLDNFSSNCPSFTKLAIQNLCMET